MASSSSPVIAFTPATRPGVLSTVRAAVPDFWTLTKPEVNFLIVIATFTGFYLGYPSNLNGFPFEQLFNTLIGTLLVASGTGTLNQVLECRFDAQMRRTSRRPIPAGRLRPATATLFGISLSVLGAAYLFLAVNALASSLAVFTLLSYLFAMPPLIGWAAASGSIVSAKAWILYAVLFLWQLPHVMAIAWMYREDYARAGYLVLPANDERRFLVGLTAVPSIALFVASLAAVGGNHGGILQYSGTLILGSSLLYYAGRQIFLVSRTDARQLLKATIIYLPLQFMILVLGKG